MSVCSLFAYRYTHPIMPMSFPTPAMQPQALHPLHYFAVSGVLQLSAVSTLLASTTITFALLLLILVEVLKLSSDQLLRRLVLLLKWWEILIGNFVAGWWLVRPLVANIV